MKSTLGKQLGPLDDQAVLYITPNRKTVEEQTSCLRERMVLAGLRPLHPVLSLLMEERDYSWDVHFVGILAKVTHLLRTRQHVVFYLQL